MVWCGVVWYGMVWYGMVWYGMVWYGMVWYGMEWYGMVGNGMEWYGMVWYGMVLYVCACFGVFYRYIDLYRISLPQVAVVSASFRSHVHQGATCCEPGWWCVYGGECLEHVWSKARSHVGYDLALGVVLACCILFSDAVLTCRHVSDFTRSQDASLPSTTKNE